MSSDPVQECQVDVSSDPVLECQVDVSSDSVLKCQVDLSSDPVKEEPDYDGSNTDKRSWLERHRPVGWKTEWLKSEDMSDAASPGDKLRRAVRLRFFNNQEVLAERVSSITEVKYLS